MARQTGDNQSLHIWFVLAILGAFLAAVGWVRWFHWASLSGWFR
jgi:hypothetical protein